MLRDVVGAEERRGRALVHVEGEDAKGGSGGVEIKIACCLFLRQSIKADCKKHLAESRHGCDVNGSDVREPHSLVTEGLPNSVQVQSKEGRASKLHFFGEFRPFMASKMHFGPRLGHFSFERVGPTHRAV